MSKIGCDNFYYAPLTKDDSTGVTYGAPVRILVSAGELVGPADNCADRFAGVG